VTNRWWCAAALALAACSSGGGGTANAVHPARTANATVQNFMKAVADSNLATMADLWGTARGPASKTRQPPDYERRIAVMRAYLNHDDFRILSDNPDGADTRRAMQVQIRRQACTWDIPFTVILLADGTWLINQVDLGAAGNPARPCDPSAKDTASTSTNP
jgi:hypothetical protein